MDSAGASWVGRAALYWPGLRDQPRRHRFLPLARHPPVSPDGKKLCGLDLTMYRTISRSCVENLSKSYLVGHERTGEPLSHLARIDDARPAEFGRKTLDMLRGRHIIQGDEVEEFWALKDVSFEVKRGEVLGIIGRNGAGKSTLLKMLSRITEPTKGRVRIRGRVASLLEVGTGFHPELTGRENIFLNGAILGMTRARSARKFDEIVAFAEIEKFLDTPVKRYSSGHVCAPRLRRGRASGAGNPGGRRSAGGGRRRISEEVPWQDAGRGRPGPDSFVRQPQYGCDRPVVRRWCFARSRLRGLLGRSVNELVSRYAGSLEGAASEMYGKARWTDGEAPTSHRNCSGSPLRPSRTLR